MMKRAACVLVGGLIASTVHAHDCFTAAGPGPVTTRVVHARTDHDGRARFTIAKRGPYLLTTVHMVRREGENGEQAVDWESYWCSLTFDVAPRAK